MGRTDNNHKYYVNDKGEHVLRVSSVIKTLAKDSLITWANFLGFKHIDYNKEIERVRNIGSLCHDVLEGYFDKQRLADIDFDRFNIGDYGSKMEVRNALESFLKWYKKFTKHHTYNVKFTEFVVVGEHLGGTIDCGIDGWKDPDKVIFVDYKTSGDFYLTQFLQLAAYVMIYEEVYGPDTVEGVMVIRMDKKGKKGEARFLPRKRLDDYITCFQCLYDVTMGVKFLNANFREDTEIF